MSTDLVSWLRSQIDADEAVARATHEPDAWWSLADLDGLGGAVHRTDAAFIASQSPTHVLRSVAAHRAILSLHVHEEESADEETGERYVIRWCDLCGEPGDCATLRHLASIYEDRPGFDPSWRTNT